MEKYLTNIQLIKGLTENTQQKNALYQEIFYAKDLNQEEKLILIRELYKKEELC